VFVDAGEFDGEQPFGEVVAYRAEVDAVDQDHAAEREHREVAVGVEPPAHVAVTGDRPAHRVGPPVRQGGDVVHGDHP
jgi:hypothetical protein